MLQDATRLLHGERGTVYKGTNCGIWDDYKLEEAILEQFNLTMVLFDSCCTDNDVWLRLTCLATDQNFALVERIVLNL